MSSPANWLTSHSLVTTTALLLHAVRSLAMRPRRIPLAVIARASSYYCCLVSPFRPAGLRFQKAVSPPRKTVVIGLYGGHLNKWPEPMALVLGKLIGGSQVSNPLPTVPQHSVPTLAGVSSIQACA